MGICDSCFAESTPEPEYVPINNNHVPTNVMGNGVSGINVNEQTHLMQSYQQPANNPMQQQQAYPPVSQFTAAPAPIPSPVAIATQAVSNMELKELKSVAPAAAPSPSPTPTPAPVTPTAQQPTVNNSQVQQKIPASTLVDPTSGVFEGLELLQKFTNKSSYDTRFIWINMQTNTMHMSQYMTKDRRHKEASLSEVTSVEEARPVKAKAVVPIDPSLCLTINFKRGGGIDLLFKNTEDRAEWASVLRRIIVSNKANDAAQLEAQVQAQAQQFQSKPQ